MNLRSRGFPALAIACAALSAAATGASAGSLVAVEHDHPDLQQMRARTLAPPPGLAPAERSRLDKLKLPVLLPDPGAMRQAAGVQAAPKPSILSDDDDPVWYHAETDLGGVSITVEADLRIQHEFPESYPVYGDKAPGAAPEAAEPLHGTKTEEGMANLVGQVTVTRYGVPYTITVICAQPDTEKCRSAEQMARDGSVLKLFAAPKVE